jgi:hypothetical protein
MKNFNRVSTWLAAILVTAGLVFAGCAAPKPKPGEIFSCVSEENLDQAIASEAELVDFSCMFKKWEGSETLHFKVAVKNTSTRAQRYRVNIFLDNGKAVGGLIPRKVKKGLVQPGQTGSFVYPVGGMGKKPKAITLMISTISQ